MTKLKITGNINSATANFENKIANKKPNPSQFIKKDEEKKESKKEKKSERRVLTGRTKNIRV